MDYASSILGFLPGGRRSTGISQLLDKLEAYLSPAQVERVREAYDFGAEKHQGQKRVSGEPYITHPVAVADILADLRLDADTLVAAILHDVIEDTPTAKAEIASIFGQVVAELVDGVSKLDQIQFKNRQEAQAESFRKMLLAMVPRHPRHHGQARRPHAQHAHLGGVAAGEAAPYGAARLSRSTPHRRALGPVRRQAGARGPWGFAPCIPTATMFSNGN